VIKVLNLEPKEYSKEAKRILETFARVSDGPCTRTELLDIIKDYDALIVRLAHIIDAQVIKAATKLRVIASATTGLNHIDLEYLRDRDIMVLSLKNEVEFLDDVHATAEHTWAMILALLRKIPAAYQSVLNGEWDRDSYKGHELNAATLGIVGLGRIGSKVARYAEVFGMKVIAYTDKYREKPPYIELVNNLDQLLELSDIITIHVPLNAGTENMIAENEFLQMKENALFVNTSRGEIVDEHALIRALEKGRIAGAAVDVICHEERMIPKGHSSIVNFARQDARLLITPHIGGATYESMEKTEVFIAEKLAKYFMNS